MTRIMTPIISVLLALTVSSVFAAEPPAPRGKAEVQAALAKAPKLNEKDLKPLNVVLVAFRKDHGANEHDYPLWQQRWQLLLGGTKQSPADATQVTLYQPASPAKTYPGAKNVTVSTAWGFPSDEQLAKADLVVLHCYVPWEPKNIAALKAYLARGGGLVLVHPACIAPTTPIVPAITELTGLAWEYGYTGFRHGAMDMKITAPDDPICLGLPGRVHFMDEAYWPLRGDRGKVKVLATSDEQDREGNAKPEPIFWTYQYGKGRCYGCILGHYTWTFDDPYMRMLLLRGMAWAAGSSPYRFDPLVLEGAPLAD